MPLKPAEVRIMAVAANASEIKVGDYDGLATATMVVTDGIRGFEPRQKGGGSDYSQLIQSMPDQNAKTLSVGTHEQLQLVLCLLARHGLDFHSRTNDQIGFENKSVLISPFIITQIRCNFGNSMIFCPWHSCR
jgi:hypothetical protein